MNTIKRTAKKEDTTMERKILFVLTLLVITAILFQLNNCILIGLGLGAVGKVN